RPGERAVRAGCEGDGSRGGRDRGACQRSRRRYAIGARSSIGRSRSAPSMKTEAIVLRAHGGPEVLVRETVDLAEPGPREARVRVRAVALNHLDLWVRRGMPTLELEYPPRLGADVVGEVEALGPGARGVDVGARVVVSPGISCGVCERCLSGQDNLCRRYAIVG